jgi:hypothetical protein
LIDLYNDATGNPTSEPVGNTPTTADIDAAKKRVDDAKAKVDAARRKIIQTRITALGVWAKAFANLPAAIQDGYDRAYKNLGDAYDNFDKAQKQFGNSKYPDLDSITLRRLRRELDDAEKEYKQARQNAIDHFTEADSLAWQAALFNYTGAQQDVTEAENELHEAENALGKLTQSATSK